MLTKEEADRFDEKLGAWVYQKGCPCITHYHKIQELVRELTEKPKRDIQVGDIYFNQANDPILVTGLDHNEIIARGAVYNSVGIWVRSTSNDGWIDLDLSKRYKLVEIEE